MARSVSVIAVVTSEEGSKTAHFRIWPAPACLVKALAESLTEAFSEPIEAAGDIDILAQQPGLVVLSE